MKKLLLFVVLMLLTIGTKAQDKANHNTSRSNKTPGGIVVETTTETGLSKADAKIAIPAFIKYVKIKRGTDKGRANVLVRTKCVKAGSTFYEFPDGTTKCLPAAVSAASQNLPSEKMDGKEGGKYETEQCCISCKRILVTNSTGTACYEKVTEGSAQSKN